ncbi:class I SAM-dependent methyltransferase [Candidatus Bathyarchaeota archaeon]|nr:class I SAM-dependent methyltransferase [Candidatus Bathyarchaeota archaeon]
MRIWKGFNEKLDYIGHRLKSFIAFSNKILRNRLTSKLFSSARFTWELAGLTRGLTVEAILRGIGDEQEFWKRGEEDASRLLKFVNKESTVLDVGCGIGRVMKSVAPHCREIHGVDTSALILRRTKNELKGLKNCFFHRKDFAGFSFPDNSFDLIYSFYTLQHMEKEDAYLSLRRMHSMIKPQGIIYIQFPDFCSSHYFSLFEEYALRHSKYGARVRCYTKPEIEQLYAGAGIKITEYKKENENIFVTGKRLTKTL